MSYFLDQGGEQEYLGVWYQTASFVDRIGGARQTIGGSVPSDQPRPERERAEVAFRM